MGPQHTVRRRTGFASACIAAFFAADCGGYVIRYHLDREEAHPSGTRHDLDVIVTLFSDLRPEQERSEKARERMGLGDAGDYTHDAEFKGGVAEGISRMVARHLAFTGSFDTVRFRRMDPGDLTDRRLDSLREAGVDAVLLGEVRHFCASYQTDAVDVLVPAFVFAAIAVPLMISAVQKEPRAADAPWEVPAFSFEKDVLPTLAGTAGMAAAAALVNLRERDVEWEAETAVELVGTENRRVLWEGTFRSAARERRSYGGFGSNKFERAMAALRAVVNQMVRSLEAAPLTGG
ncbi:MAG: hypothetical protein WB626_03445 [Bacteroidota bacterium]